MELTKIFGALCAALLVYLMVNWGAEVIYHVGDDGHGEEHASGYVIEVEEETSGEEVVEVAFADLLAAADADKGKKVFGKCKACHKVENGANATGPHLFNIVDRAIAAESGFGYSTAMAGFGGAWTTDALNEFVTKPSAYMPGTAMSFAGLKKPKDRANLIAYLATLK